MQDASTKKLHDVTQKSRSVAKWQLHVVSESRCLCMHNALIVLDTSMHQQRIDPKYILLGEHACGRLEFQPL
jgi:hypothetical protein